MGNIGRENRRNRPGKGQEGQQRQERRTRRESRGLSRWITAALALPLLLVPTARAEGPAGRVLYDFAARAEAGNVKADAGAKLTLLSRGAKVIPRVETDHTQPWPGVQLPCPKGSWDLSTFAYIEVDLHNPTGREEQVQVRVDSPGADGVFNCCTGGVTLAPGATAAARVELLRRKPDWVKVDLSGMNGYPWGMTQGWGKPGQNQLDDTHVTKLIVFLARPTEDHAFEILSVRAGGSHIPPTPLLREPEKFFPFIDTFGQYAHADWPGKTHADADLAAAREREAKDLAARPAPPSWDRFGGWKDGPVLKATSSFYAARHDGKWWLVDPEGRLFLSQGIDTVTLEGATPVEGREKWFADLPARDSAFKDCYSQAYEIVHGDYQGKHPLCFDFARANLRRKYGPDWQAAFADNVHRRLRSWGLNTLGNWSSPDVYLQHRTPYTVGVDSGGRELEGSGGYWGKFHDVFDPGFAESLKKAMDAQKGKTTDDPWCVGYFVDNEISWGEDGMSLAVAALASPPDQPAKRAFVDDLKAKYGTVEKLNAAWGTAHASWDALLQSTTPPSIEKAKQGGGAGPDLSAFYTRFAETYFRIARDAVKSAAPNHLYLGCRFAWANPAAVAAAAKYCDVVSFNVYHRTPDVPLLKADVPVVIGEFHFGALDRGMFHTGLVSVGSQAERAAAYKGYVEAGLHDPRIVGCHWFEYADEPTTGRFYDGENYQIGFVDVADTPYAETVAAAREVGQEMYRLRAAGR